MKREKLNTEVRRPQIIEAVLAVIATRGVRGLSVAAVASRVGLSPSALYRHFPSKDAMLDAVIDWVGARLLANVEAARAQASDPVEALRLMLRRHVQLIRESMAIPRIIFSEESVEGRPERKARAYRAISGYLDAIAALVREAQDLGLADRGADPRTVAVYFLGLVQPAAILWTLSEGRFDVTRHARQAWPLFARALGNGAVAAAAVAEPAPRSAGVTRHRRIPEESR